MARLSDDEIEQRLAATRWRREDDALVRDVECAGFKAAIAFVNAIAEAAEQAVHHPDILLYAYKYVRVTLSTHSEGAITERDFSLAQAIDRIQV